MDFLQVLRDAGNPTTTDALKTRWRELLVSTGSKLSNDDKMSPFWRIVTALVTEPVLWLTLFVAKTVMPNAFVKYATGEFLDILADGVNVTRKPPTRAEGIIRFTRADTGLPITVPAGTIIQTATINGVVYKLSTTEARSFSGSSPTLDVPVIAENPGSIYNFAPAYYAILPTAIVGVTAVGNPADWLTQPGTDQESDDDLRSRIRNQFNTASDYHTDSVYRSMISSFPGVSADAIWFEHNAPRGPGTANAFVLFDSSAPVSQYLADINHYITDDGNHGHGDDLIVFEMPTQDLSFNATVFVEQNLSVAERADIRDQAELFIRAAFRENTVYDPTHPAPYSRFAFSRLAEELHFQFTAIHSVVFNRGDVVTALWVPKLKTLNVTVRETE